MLTLIHVAIIGCKTVMFQYGCKLKTLFRAFCLILVSHGFSFACFSASHAKTATQHYTIGMTPDFAPYNFSKDKQYFGIDIDIAKAIFASLKLQISFVEVPLPRLTKMAIDGEIDIILSIYCNDQRSDAILVTQEPFYSIDVSAFELNTSSKHATSLHSAIQQYYVGAVRGSALADTLLAENAAHMLAVNSEQLVSQLIRKRIDFALGEDIPIRYFARQANVGVSRAFPLFSNHVCMGISKVALDYQADSLARRIDTEMVKLKRDGLIDLILHNYFQERQTAPKQALK